MICLDSSTGVRLKIQPDDSHQLRRFPQPTILARANPSTAITASLRSQLAEHRHHSKSRVE